MTRASLLSFDIDGTLEIGDPPGIIPIALVRRAKDLEYLCFLRADAVAHGAWGVELFPD